MERVTPDRKNPWGKENQPACSLCKNGDCPTGCIHLSAASHQQGNCEHGKKCAFKHTERGWERTKETESSVVVAKNIGSHPSRGDNHFAKTHSEGRPFARRVSDSSMIVTEKLDHIANKSDCLASQNVFCTRIRFACADDTHKHEV